MATQRTYWPGGRRVVTGTMAALAGLALLAAACAPTAATPTGNAPPPAVAATAPEAGAAPSSVAQPAAERAAPAAGAARSAAVAAQVKPPADAYALEEIPLAMGRGRPHDVGIALDGSIWWSAQGSNQVGRFDPATGEFTEYPLMADAGCRTIASDPNGVIWCPESGTEHLARLTPRPSGQ